MSIYSLLLTFRNKEDKGGSVLGKKIPISIHNLFHFRSSVD